MYTASSIAKKAGTTVRTVQYYDKIGLFKPVDRTDTGYRLYDDDSVGILKEILLYRDLGFPLEKIKMLLAAGDGEKKAIISGQIEAMKEQKAELEDRITAAKVAECLGIEQTYDFLRLQKEEKSK